MKIDLNQIIRKERIHGGDINDAWKIELNDGSRYFMKTNSMSRENMFITEALGLEAIKKTDTISVPGVICNGADEQAGVYFLILEFLEKGIPSNNYWEEFGHNLASLHKSSVEDLTDGKYGFVQDNYIGFTHQKNSLKTSWIEFYRENRLLPQFKMAEKYFNIEQKKACEKLLLKLDDLIPEPEFPSLIHGDLWSGNSICGPDGKAWLIDPACYAGSFEAELAMTQLFGNLPSDFYNAYDEIIKIPVDYSERRNLYNLYHLVNHLNMFGNSYLSEVISIIREYTK